MIKLFFDVPAVSLPIHDSGRYAGLPLATADFVASGIEPERVLYEFVKQLTKEQFIAEQRIAALRDQPLPPGLAPLANVGSRAALDALRELARQ